MSARSARFLLYAINGTGLGHLSRLLAVARVLRPLLRALGVRAEIAFITTSEAPEVAFDFPSYKLPSRGSIGKSDFDTSEWIGHAKLFVANVMSTLSPDVLVVDTQPEGAFAEVAFVRSTARATAFIDRHRDDRVARTETQLKHMALYDRILVPAAPSEAARHPIPAASVHRRRFIGAIHGYRPELARTRAEVRDSFGVPDDARLIYLAGGGGVDDRAGIDACALALAEDPKNFVLVGYGPLHRGPVLRRANLAPLTQPEVWRDFAGLDCAISAAGYNSYNELLAARVPTLFYAQRRGMDRQDERVRAGVEAGWHEQLVPGDGFPDLGTLPGERLRERVEHICAPSVRQKLFSALEQRDAGAGALGAARELLQLHADLPKSPLSRAGAAEVAQLFETHDGTDGDFERAAGAWLGWRRTVSTAVDDAAGRADELSDDECRRRLGWGAEPERVRERAGLEPEAWQAHWRAWARSAGGTEPELRRRVAAVLTQLDDAASGEQLAELFAQLARVVAKRDQLRALERVAGASDELPDAVARATAALGARAEPLGWLELDDVFTAALEGAEKGAGANANQR